MGVFSEFEHVVREKESLAPYTWFRLGGAAEYFAEPTTPEELAAGKASALTKVCRYGCSAAAQTCWWAMRACRDWCCIWGRRRLGIYLGREIVPARRRSQTGACDFVGGGEGLAGLEMLVGIPGSVGGRAAHQRRRPQQRYRPGHGLVAGDDVQKGRFWSVPAANDRSAISEQSG